MILTRDPSGSDAPSGVDGPDEPRNSCDTPESQPDSPLHVSRPKADLASPSVKRPRESGRATGQDERNSNDRNADDGAIYGALDLGTNNCRLLIARPSRRGFRVIDAFSRIIRLGEGLTQSGRLSDPAMYRTMEALKVCANKLERHRVSRARMVATQACRVADNGSDFIANVKHNFGLEIEVLTPEVEAKLAVSGCATLIDPTANYVLVFDIGGGSSEIIWLDLTRPGARRVNASGRINVSEAILAWTSLPVGVVTLAEKFDGRNVSAESFAAMSASVAELLAPFEAEHGLRQRLAGQSVHLLGTSGTVTTIAGIMLGLQRYDRNRVDGIWLQVPEIESITSLLLSQSYEQRIAEPCIGRERADLVLAGCAILDAILKLWPPQRLRVADRGLREGILTTLMMEDGVWRTGRRRRSRGRRNGPRTEERAG
jgi:exopolyphosphatase/guanosine-5'-triphosphate,3'-diphosphate pyrophosphatase